MKPNCSTRKRKLTGINNVNPTKRCQNQQEKEKKKTFFKLVNTSPKEKEVCGLNPKKKKARTSSGPGQRLVGNRRYQSRYTPVDEQWQSRVCQNLGLRFVRRCELDEPMSLTRPRRVMAIVCSGLFPTLLLVVKQHTQVCEAILNHLVCVEEFMIGQHITEYSTNTLGPLT